jgi:cytochrome b561
MPGGLEVENDRFTLAQRALHWLMALIVAGLLAVGLTFMVLGYQGTVDAFGNEVTNSLYKYHKTFGILVLVLMILRAVLRWLSPPPPYAQPLSPFERLASRTVHLLFYLLLIGMPIGGWLATAAGGYPVQFFDLELPGLIGKDEGLSETLFRFHGYAGLLLLALIVLHVGAGIRHLRRKDGVVRRISLP